MRELRTGMQLKTALLLHLVVSYSQGMTAVDCSPPYTHRISSLLQPLPDVFQGVHLRLPTELTDSEAYNLKRYFVGYPLLSNPQIPRDVIRRAVGQM